MEVKNSPKLAKKYECKLCDYICSKESDHKKHLATAKHLKRVGGNTGSEKIAAEFNCALCQKKYNTHSGLWKHTQKCKPMPLEEYFNTTSPAPAPVPAAPAPVPASPVPASPVPAAPVPASPVPASPAPASEDIDLELKTLSALVINLIKSNQDLQKQMLDVCQKIQPNTTINNTHTNSHNKTFNLQFFLNEQCKDAMNIMEFVDTFQLQFSDLERIGEVGYVEGISSIVMDKLCQMDIYKRPIHCSDAKREIMHVKDKNVWEKENATNDKIRLALKHITKKNTDMIGKWVNAHPGVLDSEHRLNDKYQQLFIEAMGGNKNKTMKEGEDKIIKKISKMVLIDKGLA